MKILLVAVLSVFMVGCVTTGVVIQKARDANDSLIESAEFALCEAAPIGAIKRNYGHRADVYNEFCRESGADLLK